MFDVKIKEVSKELTAKERIFFKDTQDAIKLDEAANEECVIYPEYWGVLNIHNDKADPTDYENYVLVAGGKKYVTGSSSFWNSFKPIADEMAGESEKWGIKVYKKDSKNYKGKKFIQCSII